MDRPGATPPRDALLVVGFGGPEGMADVLPFLERVTAGRGIPAQRLREVAKHYEHFEGVSPINQQVRDLIGALEPELRARGVGLPVYWGNRNWHPLLPDTLRRMRDEGRRHAHALVLAAYSSYSSCRQYLESIDAARMEVGPEAPLVEVLRIRSTLPDFVAANAARLRAGVERVPAAGRDRLHVAFTAHSIPRQMAEGCVYEAELTETCSLTAAAAGVRADAWRLVYQSRSGRPTDPWLEPDILDHLEALRRAGVEDVVVHPIGFLSDHMEVLHDLDIEARERAAALGLRMVRSATVGTHPLFVALLAGLVADADGGRRPEPCAAGCCPRGATRPAATPAAARTAVE